MTAKATIGLNIVSEDAEAIQSLLKFADAQRKADEATKGAAAAARGQTQEIDKGAIAWGKWIATAAGVGSVTAALGKGMQLLKDYDERLKLMAGRQADMATAGMSLAMMQPAGQVQPVLERAAVLSAAAGVKPEEGGFLAFQRMQSLYGSFDAAEAPAVTLMKFSKLTGDLQEAISASKTAPALGLSMDEMFSRVIGASFTTAAGEADIMKALWTLPAFTSGGQVDPNFGFAALNALSSRLPLEKLETYSQAASKALGDVGGTLQKTIPGYAEMDLTSRLEAIGSAVTGKYGGVTVESLQQAGFGEMQERTALAALLDPQVYAEQFRPTLEAGPGMAERFSIDRRYAEMLESPQIRFAMQRDTQTALAGTVPFVSAEGDLALKRTQESYRVAMRNQFRWGVDPETGEAGHLLRVADFAEQSGAGRPASVAAALLQPGGVARIAADLASFAIRGRPEGGSSADLVDRYQEEYLKRMMENTEALRANTEVRRDEPAMAGSRVPMGGDWE